MTASLKGQIGIIGSGLGDIGRAIATELAALGADMAIGDILDASAAKALLKALRDRGDRARYDRADLSDATAIAEWFVTVERDLGVATLITPNAETVTTAGIRDRAIGVISLVNGSAGYLVPRELRARDSYETNQTPFAAGPLERVIESAASAMERDVVSTKALAGVLPVFQTPYNDDETIDAPTLEREINWLFDNGADGIVMAMVSEVLRLSTEERRELATLACKFAGSRGSVVISVGAESSIVAEGYAKHAQDNGATALMAIPPVSVALIEAELMNYFRRIIRAVSIPTVVQDASGYVGWPMSIAVQKIYWMSSDLTG